MLWIEFRILGGSEQGRAGLPGHGFLEKNFELCFEGSRKWLALLCYFQEKAKQQGMIRGVIKQVAAEFFLEEGWEMMAVWNECGRNVSWWLIAWFKFHGARHPPWRPSFYTPCLIPGECHCHSEAGSVTPGPQPSKTALLRVRGFLYRAPPPNHLLCLLLSPGLSVCQTSWSSGNKHLRLFAHRLRDQVTITEGNPGGLHMPVWRQEQWEPVMCWPHWVGTHAAGLELLDSRHSLMWHLWSSQGYPRQDTLPSPSRQRLRSQKSCIRNRIYDLLAAWL